MKNLILVLAIALMLTSCKKESLDSQDSEVIKVSLFFNSAYGDMKVDETSYHIRTNGEVLDTIGGSVILELNDLDYLFIEINSSVDFSLVLIDSEGEVFRWENINRSFRVVRHGKEFEVFE
tara:strand:+ start:809 stop:1171 length:363 start_codon:yes stop_codon:yes gene_type:complete